MRDNFGTEVFGEVKNNQSTRLQFITVAVTYYDKTGNVRDVAYSYSKPDVLDPNGTATYMINSFSRPVSGLPNLVQTEGWIP